MIRCDLSITTAQIYHVPKKTFLAYDNNFVKFQPNCKFLELHKELNFI